MSSSAIVILALKASLALMVFGVGLQSTPRDATFLARHPALLGRSFLAMFVLMPLLAVSLTTTFALTRVVSLALVALTLAPVPPFLPTRVMRSGGDSSYMVSLLATASLASIVVIPLSIAILGSLFAEPLHLRPAVIVKLVGLGILVPLAAGIALRAAAPGSLRLAKPVGLLSLVVLVAAMIPLLVTLWPAMRTLIGNGTLLAIAALTLAGVAIGHLLGGSAGDDRTALALATSMRHPAVAIAILTANFPNETLAPAAVVLSMIVGAIASTPYAMWRKHGSARRPAVQLHA